MANTIVNNAPLTIASVKRALLEYSKDVENRDLALCQKMVDDCYVSDDYKEADRFHGEAQARLQGALEARTTLVRGCHDACLHKSMRNGD